MKTTNKHNSKKAASKHLSKKKKKRSTIRLNKHFNLGFIIDRQLLENCGYNTDELSDTTMDEIAGAVGGYMDNEYGSSVLRACDDFDIPKRKTK